MARGCPGSDSEEERHDRFRSERNSGSLNASKSLFSTGLQPGNKARSPLRRLNSPPRRDRRSTSKRSRSRSKRRSKERKKSKERRESKDKSKSEKINKRNRSNKIKEARYTDEADSVRSESRRRSRSKGRRRSESKEKKKKSRENKKNHAEKNDQKTDLFLERFERRRPSVENEEIDGSVIYRDSSPEHESQLNSRTFRENKAHKKEKRKRKERIDAEEGELISEEENNCFGPALPPKFESDEEEGELKDNKNSPEGPALPPGYSSRPNLGPALPERICSQKRSNSQEERQKKMSRPSKSDSEEENMVVKRPVLIGPSLPPKEILPSVGPTLPEKLCLRKRSKSQEDRQEKISRLSKSDSEEESKELQRAVLSSLPLGDNPTTIEPERSCSRKRRNSLEGSQKKIPRLTKSDSEEENKEVQRAALIGPSLPPRESLPSIGNDEEEFLYGPALPPQPTERVEEEMEAEMEDDPLIGPLPKGMKLDDRVQRILEERAQTLRKQMENKDTDGGTGERKGREDWMVELPDVKTAAHLGLGPRKFKTRECPDLSDRSSWTDIAGIKQNKVEDKEVTNIQEDNRKLEISARNTEMERRAKETSSNRDKSLLETHQKEMKKKKKKDLEKSGGKEERRPFSREIDLQSNRFDEARTKSIIKKAQFLDSRFSSGESKYL